MKYETIIPTLIIIWAFIKRWFDQLSKVIEPLIAEVEKMAQDGKIDKAERKSLVMRAISILEAQGKIKLNFISRIVVSKIVDIIASKMPDFKITSEATKLINDVKYKEIS